MYSLFVSAVVLGIAFCAPPGVVTAESVRCGLRGGFRPVMLIQVGSLVGDATWATIADSVGLCEGGMHLVIHGEGFQSHNGGRRPRAAMGSRTA